MTRVVLVGGGLANSLIAYRLRSARPDISITLLEREGRLGGNHVWCFHEGDLSERQRAWIAPLVARSWPEHEVRFPRRQRRIERGYHALTSERLDRVVRETLGEGVRLDVDVDELDASSVHLGDGTRLTADLVIDGRGDRAHDCFELAYQKFVGREVVLAEPHGLAGPILMDATVEQRDGFRFLYTLPFDERRVLIEDTRYSDTPELDRDEMRAEIERYATEQGWTITEVEREEDGILPIVLAGDIDAFWRNGPTGVPRSGLRAALFHQTTGYSLPDAVRLADSLAASADLRSGPVARMIEQRSRMLWRRQRFFRLLNRMLFRAAVPEHRYVVLQRFYGLSVPLIERFYAGHLTTRDRLRILTGRPPVPLTRALGCLRDAPLPNSLPQAVTS